MIYFLSFLVGCGIVLELQQKNWSAVIWAVSAFIWMLMATLK